MKKIGKEEEKKIEREIVRVGRNKHKSTIPV